MPKKSKTKAVATHPSVLASLTGILTAAAAIAAEKYLGPGTGAIIAGAATGGALLIPSPGQRRQ